MSKPLMGQDIIGRIYNIDGLYASQDSVGQLLFNFKKPTKESNVNGINYSHSNSLDVVVLNDNSLDQKTSFEQDEEKTKFSFDTDTKGSYEGFSAEVKFRYGKESTRNTSLWNATKEAIVRSYKIRLPDPQTDSGEKELIRLLKPEVKEAFKNLNAKDLVKSFGTHFVWSAIFGGKFSMSQSFSKYYYSSKEDIQASINASYLAYINSKNNFNFDKFKARNKFESDAQIHSKGCSPATLFAKDGEDAFVKSVDGRQVIVDFENDDSFQSLQRISILVEDESKKQEINKAIDEKLNSSPNELTKSLSCQNRSQGNAGNPTPQAMIPVLDNNEIIIGIAAKEQVWDHSKHTISRLAAKMLNLKTGESRWVEAFKDNKHWASKWQDIPATKISAFNSNLYDHYVEAPIGEAIVGVGVREYKNKVKTIMIESLPINGASRYGLSQNMPPQETVGAGGDTSNIELKYNQGSNPTKVLTGIGLGVKDKKFYSLVYNLAELQVTQAS